ncbi:MAG: hypothetical protein AAF927_28800 [Bacteroidota bacterium]
MKKIALAFLCYVMIIHPARAQESKGFSAFSIYTGVQNPIEIDVFGFGVDTRYQPGFKTGLAFSGEIKRLKVSLHVDYMNSKIETDDEEPGKNYLNYIQTKVLFWANVLAPGSKMKLNIGIGAGIMNYHHPSITRTLESGRVYSREASWDWAPAIHSGLNFTYQFEEKLYLTVIQANDVIPDFASEFVFHQSIVFGIQRAF